MFAKYYFYCLLRTYLDILISTTLHFSINLYLTILAPCQNIRDEEATVERVCRALKPNQQLITLFSENYVPVNCRSSLEGVWNFAYQNRFKFTGECNHPDAQIRSCQTAGSQFLITNQKFNITYRKCEGMSGTFDGGKTVL